MTEKKKPITREKSWHLRSEYIDSNGDVYSKGKFVRAGEPSKVEAAPTEKLSETISEEDTQKLLLEQLQAMRKELDELKQNKSVSANVPAPLIDSKEFAEAIVRAGDESKGKKYLIDEKDIPEGDYIEKGITFSAAGAGYIQVGDIRQGQYVDSPYKNIIKFKYQATDKRGGRNVKEEVINHYCTYTTHSKKVVKWLREHTLYGIKFWESAREALDADSTKAAIAANIMLGLSKQDGHQLRKMCMQEKISIYDDLGKMRALLANKLAEKKMIAEYKNSMDNASKAIEMFGG